MQPKATFSSISELLLRKSEHVQRLSLLGVTIEFLVTGHDTDGAWATITYAAPPQFRGPVPHWHKQLTETFIMLEGRLLFRIDGKEQELVQGELIAVPPGIVHSFSNPYEERARVLILLSPGGFEEYFTEMAELIANEPSWPPADMSQVSAIGQRYDTFAPELRGESA